MYTHSLSMLNSWFTNIFSKFSTILLALLILLVMITIHELGHYLFGKMLKFKINEFAVGFGKKLWSRTNKSGEVVSVRLIPLGGFCAFEGEDENSNNKDAFNNKEPWKRLVVLFGGVLFNFLSAIIFSIVLLAVVGNGIPKVAGLDTANNSSLLALQQNDIILEVNDVRPTFLNGGIVGLTSAVELEEPIELTIKRDGKVLENKIIVYKFESEINGQMVTRIGLETSLQKLSFGEALLQSVPFTFELAWECMVLIFKLFTGGLALNQVGGPITTISVISEATTASMYNVLLLLPLIAVNLAVFNLLPIPALDGARMIFVLIEMIRKKPINRDLEAKIHAVGLMILFSLVILLDILQIVVFR